MDLLRKDRNYSIEEMIKFISGCNKTYIYGAGKVGGKIAVRLKEMDIPWTAFVVTDVVKSAMEFMGHPVYGVEKVKFERDDGIILAVVEKSQSQLWARLKELRCPAKIYEQRLYGKEFRIPENYLTDANKDSGFFANFQILNRLGEYFGTDKYHKGHDYLRKYELFLQYWRDKEFTLLELGVYHGASLFTWGGDGDKEGYFSNAKIIGVDINPDCCQYAGRQEVIIKDLGKIDDLIELKSLRPSMIVDDASHYCTHQIMALLILWDGLPSGGIYIVEDIDTSFEHIGYYGYDDAVISAYDVCRAIAECVTSGGELRKQVPLCEHIEKIASQIDMISFIHGSCIMIKK